MSCRPLTHSISRTVRQIVDGRSRTAIENGPLGPGRPPVSGTSIPVDGSVDWITVTESEPRLAT